MSATTDCFADATGGVPAAEWDRLADGRFYSSALWLRLCAMAPGSVSGGVRVVTSGAARPRSRWPRCATSPTRICAGTTC